MGGRPVADRKPKAVNKLQSVPEKRGGSTESGSPNRKNNLRRRSRQRNLALAHRIGIADSTLRPSRPGRELPDGHRWAPQQHAPDSRPARRANENRLTRGRIDQAPAPGRLNEVETHGVIPGSSVRRPRNRSKTGSRASPGSHHPTPKSAKRGEGKEDSTGKNTKNMTGTQDETN